MLGEVDAAKSARVGTAITRPATLCLAQYRASLGLQQACPNLHTAGVVPI